jgi:hypothetical protein
VRRLRLGPWLRAAALAHGGSERKGTARYRDVRYVHRTAFLVNARRVCVTINELKVEDWGIGGHTDWLREYTTAFDEVGGYKAPARATD